MKEHTRNVLVGLTVIVALMMLGAMILLFTGLPGMFQRGRVLRMTFPATSDVHTGDPVHLAGIRVGKIIEVDFVQGDPRKGVQLVARIDHGVRIPGDTQPVIFSRGFIGSAYVSLEPGGTRRVDPRTRQPLAFLPDDWDEPLAGTLKQGMGLLPDELMDELVNGLRNLSKLADNLNELFAPAAAPASGPSRPGATQPAGGSLRESLAQLGRAAAALDQVLSDPNSQANLKTSLANLAIATEKAADAMDALKSFATEAGKTAGEVRKGMADARQTIADAGQAAKKFSSLAENADQRVQELSEKLIDDAEKISSLLSSINKAATKIESGEGTAGKLINDPKLYNNLLEATEQLKGLMKEFRGLIEQIKKGGLKLKVT